VRPKNIGRGRTSLVLFPGAENPSYATDSSSSSSGGSGSGSGDRSANEVKSKTHSHGEKLCHNANANNMLVLAVSQSGVNELWVISCAGYFRRVR